MPDTSDTVSEKNINIFRMSDTSDTAFEKNKKIFLILILLILVLIYAKKKQKLLIQIKLQKRNSRTFFGHPDTSDAAFEKNRDIF